MLTLINGIWDITKALLRLCVTVTGSLAQALMTIIGNPGLCTEQRQSRNVVATQSTQTEADHVATEESEAQTLPSTRSVMTQTDITYVIDSEPDDQPPLENVQIIQITDVTPSATLVNVENDNLADREPQREALISPRAVAIEAQVRYQNPSITGIWEQRMDEVVLMGSVGEVTVGYSGHEEHATVVNPNADVPNPWESANQHHVEAASCTTTTPDEIDDERPVAVGAGTSSSGSGDQAQGQVVTEANESNNDVTDAAKPAGPTDVPKPKAKKWQVPKKVISQYGTRSQKGKGK